ncbi:Crotonobetainyl-CoA reductase [Achromobacter pestifer]|uniref:Crotonobetainyl-CoA reductase n=1 Tax=Achromobacter pestifer TaxID=1353889 RepID=A0A6S6ZTF2_9BURK|nr:Crotonobetainyl-CoA reductase [Achromobacter pestifer]
MPVDTDLEGFRTEVRAFLCDRLPVDLRRKVLDHQRLEKQDFLRWHQILHERGWVAPNWPKEHGGAAWDIGQRNVFDEECALAGAPETVPFGLRMVAPVIMAYGSAWQKSHFLPRILSGQDWWCQGYSEPGAGSDLASLSTRARREGDTFVVNGQKTWTTYAQYADMMFCLARTDPDAKAQEGISFLLIDMRSPGVSLRPIRTLDGGDEINEVFLDDVVVPATHLVGEADRGWTYAKYLLSHERFGAARVGRAKRELGHLQRLAAQRVVDGVTLADDPVFAHRLAQLEIDTLALEQTNLRLIARDQRGAGHGAEASILKYLGSTLAQRISEALVDTAGSHALAYQSLALERDYEHGEPTMEEALEAMPGFYLNLRKISIYGGTDEVQKNIIAKLALGAADDYSDDERALDDAVARYLQGEYPAPAGRPALPVDADPASSPHWRTFADMGLLGLGLPAAAGGMESALTDVCVLMQQFGRHLVTEPYDASALLCGQLLALMPDGGTVHRLLAGIAQGSAAPVLASAGPRSEWSLDGEGVTAERQGEDWILNGVKRRVPFGAGARQLLVTARDAQGVGLFLVEAEAHNVMPGVTRQGAVGVDGRSYADITFNGCRVPDAARLGEVGNALEQAADTTRIALCAEALGAMQALLDATREHTDARRQFGRALSGFQAVQHRLVDMLLVLEQARSLTWTAARADTADARLRGRLVSAAKARCGEAARYISQQSIQLHGGMGMTDELPVGHYVKRLLAIEYTLGDTRHHLNRYQRLARA